MISTHVAAVCMYLVVGILLANIAHRVTKFAAPVLAGRPLDVGDNDEEDNFIADVRSVSVGFRGLGTKTLDVHYHLDAKVEFG